MTLLTLALTAAGSATATAQPAAPAAAPSTVLMVIDTSGSMAGTRLDQAKTALNGAIDALVPGQRAGLRDYGGGCGDGGRLRVPVGADNGPALRTAVAGLVASGGTPTTDALRSAAADLASSGKRSIVLVSDGQSTCGDPCPVAAEIAQQQGIDFTVHTVGFHAPDAAEDELACVARVTGGKYFAVDDAAGLNAALGNVITGGTPATPVGHEYVAVGDSTTTGFSIATCVRDRKNSPFGCTGNPPATAYPQLVAQGGGPSVDDLDRKGIWGYTIREAVADADRGTNLQGGWIAQLVEAERATKLVTVSIGANDMDFSNVNYWLLQCVGAKQKSFFGVKVQTGFEVTPNCRTAAQKRATSPETRRSLDAMFNRLDRAKANGARVVITLYYNAMNPVRKTPFLPDRSCALLNGISDRIVGAINGELDARSKAHGFTTVDLGRAFDGHGAGSLDSYVFGTECEMKMAAGGVDFDLGWPPVDLGQTKKNVQIMFDPHPNAKGTRAQANAVLGATRGL